MKFRNVHALVKQNRPLSEFTWINSLDEKKELEHGKTYNNRWAATACLESISEIVKCEVVGTVKNSSFFFNYSGWINRLWNCRSRDHVLKMLS